MMKKDFKKLITFINRVLRNRTFIVVFASLSFIVVFSQEAYKTSNGHLIIKANMKSQPITISSHDMIIMLDYETGKIEMRQHIASLIADDDSTQNTLISMENQDIEFKGKLGLDYINTSGHPPLDFQIEGIVLPSNQHIIGTGHLEHVIEGSINACILSLSFQLDLEKIYPDYQLSMLAKEVNVYVFQSLLSREIK